MIQAVLPLIIKTNFSKNIAIYMGVYVTAIMGGAALSSVIVPVIENQFHSWQFSLACWSLLTVITILSCFYVKNILWKNEPEIDKKNVKNLNFSLFHEHGY